MPWDGTTKWGLMSWLIIMFYSMLLSICWSNTNHNSFFSLLLWLHTNRFQIPNIWVGSITVTLWNNVLFYQWEVSAPTTIAVGVRKPNEMHWLCQWHVFLGNFQQNSWLLSTLTSLSMSFSVEYCCFSQIVSRFSTSLLWCVTSGTLSREGR